MKEVSSSIVRLITILALGAVLLANSANAQSIVQSSDADGPILKKEALQIQQATLDSVEKRLAPLKGIGSDVKASREAAESASTKFTFFGAGLAAMIAALLFLANKAVEAQADLRKTDRDYADRMDKNSKDFIDRLEKIARDFGDKLEKGLKELGDRIEKSDKLVSERLVKFEERMEKTSKDFADELTKSNKDLSDKLTGFGTDLALMRQENAYILDSSKYTVASMRQDNIRATEDARKSLSDIKDILIQEVRQEFKEIKSTSERSNYILEDPFSSDYSRVNAIRQQLQEQFIARTAAAAVAAAAAAASPSTGTGAEAASPNP